MLKTLIHTDLHMFYSILFNLRQSAKSVVRNRGYNSHKLCKTKPIYSLCVLRDAYCERNLKKQSQFENTQMNVSALVTRDYGKSRKWTIGENKAKQSQFFYLQRGRKEVRIQNTEDRRQMTDDRKQKTDDR